MKTDARPCSKIPTVSSARPALWSTVFAAGDIDLVGAPTLLADVLALAAPGRLGVAVDFTHVEFVDAAGINALVQARNQLRTRGADVVVRSPTDQLRWMLKLFELGDLVEPVAAHSDSHSGC